MNYLTRSKIITVLMVIACGAVHAQQFSELTSVSLPPVASGIVAWGDYDNDGDFDFAVTGDTAVSGLVSSKSFTRLYKNTGGIFTWDTNVQLYDMYISSLAWIDFDNDNDLDLVISGSNSTIGGQETYLYRNNPNHTFSLVSSQMFAGYQNLSLDVGDYDHDGNDDLAIMGYSTQGVHTKIYHNNGNNSFTEKSQDYVIDVSDGNIKWIDYDQDGRLDLFVTGRLNVSGEVGITRLYHNIEDTTFVEVTQANLRDGMVSNGVWADFDNDGFPDLFLVGVATPSRTDFAVVYKNNGDGTFTEKTQLPVPANSPTVSCFDYNDDGFVDILWTYGTVWPSIKTSLHKNDQNFVFTDLGGCGILPLALHGHDAGDYDGDGDLDIVIGGLNTDNNRYLKIYENTSVGMANSVPSAPMNLKVIPDNTGFLLSWDRATDTESPQNALTYNVFVGTSQNATDVVSPMADLNTGFRRLNKPGNAYQRHSYYVKKWNPSTTYYWGVQSIDQAGGASTFAKHSFSVIGLTTTAISTSQINLQWTAAVSTPDWYRIYRKKDTEFVQIDSVVGSNLIYSNVSLDTLTQYEYKIDAIKNQVVTAISNLSKNSTFGIPPTQAESVQATAVSASQIDVTWAAGLYFPEMYRVLRREAGIFVQIDSVLAPTATYSDTGLLPNTKYEYKIIAVNDWGISPLSAEASDTTHTAPPKKPTNVTAVALSSEKIKLTWTASQWFPALYRIFRQIGNTFHQIDSVEYASTTYTDSLLLPFTTYKYKVMSVNEWGGSLSDVIEMKTLGVPPTSPSGLVAQSVSSSQINLSWGLSDNSPDWYRIFRSTGSGYSQIDSVNGSLTAYSNSGLQPLVYYSYKIMALNEWGISSFSNASGDTTVDPVAPSILSYALSKERPVAGEGFSVFVSSQNATSMTMEYGIGGTNNGVSQSLIFSAGQYSKTIPSAVVTASGVWFRVRAENKFGVTYFPSATGKSTIPVSVLQSQVDNVRAQGAFPLGIGENVYYTIALPFQGSVDLTTILGKQEKNTRDGLPSNWRLIKYGNEGAFTDETILNGNTGYFIYHNKKHAVEFFDQLDTLVSNDFSYFDNILLKPGWNLVAWPYAFPAGLVQTDHVKIGSMWDRINGSWEQTTTVKPFGAYAVRNRTGSNVKMGDVMQWVPQTSKAIPHESSSVWRIRLKAQAKGHTDRFNYIGVSPDAEMGVDPLDEEEPAMLVNDIGLCFEVESENKMHRLSADIRPESEDCHVWDFVVENGSSSEVIYLSCESEKLPEGYQVSIMDMSSNRMITDPLNQEYAVKQQKNRFKVLVGFPDQVQSKVEEIRGMMPESFGLAQNYPNPFNPTTRINFDVAHAGDVSIKVYNLLGQEVYVLTNSRFEPGRYSVSWNGKDHQGNTVASGIYIYRMKTINAMYSKKMLFLK